MKKMALTASAIMFASTILLGGNLAFGQYTQSPEAMPGPDVAPQASPETTVTPAPGTAATQPQMVPGIVTDEQAAAALKNTENIVGKTVQSPQGEKLGKIKSLMVDLNTGQVGYAVLASGGMLGMGQEDYLVPWNALVVKPETDNLVLNVSPQELQKAPKGEKVATYEEGRQIHLFYGCPVYWEEPLRQTQPVPVPKEPGYLEQPEPSLREPSVQPPGAAPNGY